MNDGWIDLPFYTMGDSYMDIIKELIVVIAAIVAVLAVLRILNAGLNKRV